jgi:hypothetical protein
MLLYSNNGKKLYNPNQIESSAQIGVQLFLFSMYFISPPSKIGNIKIYNIINITEEINTSVT